MKGFLRIEGRFSDRIPVRGGVAYAFTLIEMLVSMVVLALLVIAMMALVEERNQTLARQ